MARPKVWPILQHKVAKEIRLVKLGTGPETVILANLGYTVRGNTGARTLRTHRSKGVIGSPVN